MYHTLSSLRLQFWWKKLLDCNSGGKTLFALRYFWLKSWKSKNWQVSLVRIPFSPICRCLNVNLGIGDFKFKAGHSLWCDSKKTAWIIGDCWPMPKLALMTDVVVAQLYLVHTIWLNYERANVGKRMPCLLKQAEDSS